MRYRGFEMESWPDGWVVFRYDRLVASGLPIFADCVRWVDAWYGRADKHRAALAKTGRADG